MRKPLLLSMITVALGLAVFAVQAQNPPAQNAPAQNPPQGQAQGQQPGRGRAGADPYANNATPGTLTFPLAARARASGRQGRSFAEGWRLHTE